MQHRELPEGWDRGLPRFEPDAKGLATRDSSAKVLNVLAENVPWLLGGSADLTPSTKTRLAFAGAGDLSATSPGGRNLHFGIREHAMAAIVNGLSLSKLRPYGSTFLTFSDYARPALRLAALMAIPVIHVFTHDSIGLGEDGPTHQPVEQLASLRAIPGLITLRPADANETVEAWRVIMQLRHEPVVLVLSRQPLPTFDRAPYAAASGVAQGAYVLADPQGSALYSWKKTGKLEASGSSITEGIGTTRITANFEGTPVNDAVQITDKRAVAMVYRLLRDEGLFVGGSTGINVCGAVDTARALGPGHTIVTVLCDSGSRYQSKLYNPEFLRAKGLPTPPWLDG